MLLTKIYFIIHLVVRKKLALKAFSNAKQYFTTQHYKSALVALDNVLIDFNEDIIDSLKKKKVQH